MQCDITTLLYSFEHIFTMIDMASTSGLYKKCIPLCDEGNLNGFEQST